MKFKTRLKVTFVTIVFLPLLLTTLAFCVIGVYLTSAQPGVSVQNLDFAMISEPVGNFTGRADNVYGQLVQQAEKDVSMLENKEYLDKMGALLHSRSAYLLVRKDAEIYYAGNEEAALQIFPMLPGFGEGDLEEGTGYYFSEMDKYVKQIDFRFQDGSEGSLFVVMRINSLISRRLLIDMVIAIVLILIFTSLMLTQWIQKEVFSPINELNVAMTKIKEGNFEYILQTRSGGEIGDLYRNYEDMRLRLKENTEESAEQEKKNKELVSNISHDLKTPITAIKGYVEGIMDGVADTPEKMDKYIKTIYNKANDMDRLINELTLYSGISSNRIPYNFHRINVREYFNDCIEEVGLDLESQNIELDYDNLVDEDTKIIADPEQLRRVINNIINNSIKYMDKEKGVIEIRILDQIDSVRIEIEDNGRGISQKDLPRIFERFYRTDASRNSTKGGSGIGLSIVKKIVEDHGGYIWATSKENEGTCIHFVIRKHEEVEKDE